MGTLKVQEVRCPECNELLEINSGKMIGFCPYCGKALHLEETPDGPSFTYTYNYNENKKQHLIDEAKIMHEQAELEKKKSDDKSTVLITALMVLMFLGMFAMVALSEIFS